jgi:hypothetical protein
MPLMPSSSSARACSGILFRLLLIPLSTFISGFLFVYDLFGLIISSRFFSASFIANLFLLAAITNP